MIIIPCLTMVICQMFVDETKSCSFHSYENDEKLLSYAYQISQQVVMIQSVSAMFSCLGHRWGENNKIKNMQSLHFLLQVWRMCGGSFQ